MAYSVGRIYKIACFFFVIGSLLIARLFYLQVLESPKLAIEGLSGRVEEVPVGVSRGNIYDRNGIPLTNTAQSFYLTVFPGQIKDKKQTVDQLVNLLGLDKQVISQQLMEEWRPFKINTALTEAEAQQINQMHMPGVLAIAEKNRYGHSSLAVHVTGYVNAADNRGVSGIESMYDELLAGDQTEHVAALVDAGQRLIPGLGYTRLKLGSNTEPSNVVLTLDSRIQKVVETVMDRYGIKGAIVILQPYTGEILAMASRPNFDPEHIESYLNLNTAPFLNRALSAYQPGSVFKLVVAAAALENHIVQPEDVFFDPGYVTVNDLRFYGWDYERGERGYITFTDAMAYSSNPTFITVGLKLGAEKLISFAHKLGFGSKTSLSFDEEAAGNLPVSDNIYPGELANLAIGQGSFEATPLQFAALVATIVNDGIKVNPYIVGKLTNVDGKVIKTFSPNQGVRVFSSNTAQAMRRMMTAVTRYGTGEAADIPDFGSAGKTGSAETGRMQKGKSVNHAWFAGYTPLERPQYAAVIFVEEGRSGGDVAAPLFHEIFTQILKKS
ncbi:putative membrane protein [Propionispora sp. 2/2-37]|uniref:peptidoglycan D,D-transpeptidase FtsI family protein n=1 Tax=Propionispora sp. 2/2-37 TaxID=1677858 RepID=UPI0006BB83E6|nr:penicillin-binding protein 2 [Propionispora sp. 2/2-37]CUH97428.1 putative membrane protein [Propionispora sp. 2/2-37]